jgi:hypothetical protein
MPRQLSTNQQRRATFKRLLHLALTSGRMPSTRFGLNPATIAAIELVACEHPYADAACIAAAYDAFEREHRGR